MGLLNNCAPNSGGEHHTVKKAEDKTATASVAQKNTNKKTIETRSCFTYLAIQSNRFLTLNAQTWADLYTISVETTAEGTVWFL